MNVGGQRDSVTASTWVHVEVKGSLDIPLDLSILADLGDPIVEQEIVKEAVRIAVSERIGYFGGVEVRLSSSGGLESDREAAAPTAWQRDAEVQQQEAVTASSLRHKRNGSRRRYCEARIHLDELGRCVESIQQAYDGLLAHAHTLHELLNADAAESPARAAAMAAAPPEPAAASAPQPQEQNDLDLPVDAAKRLAAVRQLVADIVANHRSDIIAEAETLQDGASSQRPASHEVAMLAEEHAETSAAILARRYGSRPSNGDRSIDTGEDKDADAGLRVGLLAGGDEEAEGQHPQQAEDDANAIALRARYAELGYSPL
ncbi:hypothetical protein LSCM1_04715 [Leishmania martiniquensis]|uniref:Uncharacterized protein n=1 Tax=Leishmania martiniquensis TaxID=1580590 RepID=A0A836KNC6_9TRYP|nr:hypothetical protein LSCM1_04715 [Leishmania martiniquensis]